MKLVNNINNTSHPSGTVVISLKKPRHRGNSTHTHTHIRVTYTGVSGDDDKSTKTSSIILSVIIIVTITVMHAQLKRAHIGSGDVNPYLESIKYNL